MKIFVLIILICVSTYVGYAFSKKYKQRANFFMALIGLCQKFDVEINYSRERVKNIFNNLDEKLKRNLQGIDENYVECIEKKSHIEAGEIFKNITFLKDNEKDIILPFFKSLGRSDVESQSREIKNYQSRFESLSSQSQQENKKYGSLSIKLGLILGLLVAVIFI